MSEKPELLPCFHCGDVPEMPKNFYDICFNEDCDEFQILCRKCLAMGPSVSGEWDCDGPKEAEQFAETLPQVVEAWNRRSLAPQAQGAGKVWHEEDVDRIWKTVLNEYQKPFGNWTNGQLTEFIEKLLCAYHKTPYALLDKEAKNGLGE